MLLMIESGIRGGIATISHHHAKAINEYMLISLMVGKCRNNFQHLDLSE